MIWVPNLNSRLPSTDKNSYLSDTTRLTVSSVTPGLGVTMKSTKPTCLTQQGWLYLPPHKELVLLWSIETYLSYTTRLTASPATPKVGVTMKLRNPTCLTRQGWPHLPPRQGWALQWSRWNLSGTGAPWYFACTQTIHVRNIIHFLKEKLYILS